MREDSDAELAETLRPDPTPGWERERERIYMDVDARVRKYLKRRKAIDAEDVAQELATRLWVLWSADGADFVAPEDPQSFAETMVRNYYRNEGQRLANWRKLIDDDPNVNVEEIALSTAPDPHDAIVDVESNEQVERWLARLPERRGAVMRRVFAGREYSEIATELGIAESTVRNHVFDAYEVLDPIVVRYYKEGR